MALCGIVDREIPRLKETLRREEDCLVDITHILGGDIKDEDEYI